MRRFLVCRLDHDPPLETAAYIDAEDAGTAALAYAKRGGHHLCPYRVSVMADGGGGGEFEVTVKLEPVFAVRFLPRER